MSKSLEGTTLFLLCRLSKIDNKLSLSQNGSHLLQRCLGESCIHKLIGKFLDNLVQKFNYEMDSFFGQAQLFENVSHSLDSETNIFF